MKLHILALSHKIEPWAQEAIDQFSKRFPPDWPLTIRVLKPEDRATGKPVAQLLAKEAERIRQAVPQGCLLVALDERGHDYTSEKLAETLLKWHDQGQSICLLIGSADGLDPDLKRECHAMWRLSSLTLPHSMARVLITEALYRAWSILAGHPYHRQ